MPWPKESCDSDGVAALIPIHDSWQHAVLPAGSNDAVDVSERFVEQMQESWRTTAGRCRRRGVALYWRIADECRGIRLSPSDLLHVTGVLHELVADSIERGGARNLRVDFRCLSGSLIVVVEDDGNAGPSPTHSECGNIEYLAAQLAGRIRHRSRQRHRASLFWLPLGTRLATHW